MVLSSAETQLLTFTSMGASVPVTLSSVEALTERLLARAGRASRNPELGLSLAMPNVAGLVSASPFMAQRFLTNEARVVSVTEPLGAPRPRTPGARAAALASLGLRPAQSMVLATCTVIVEGARAADLEAATGRGARLLHEGFDGKCLLQCDSVEQAFGIANLLQSRQVGSATPNFVRYVSVLPAAAGAGSLGWAHKKIRVPQAWQVTQGNVGIKIAVLDEGVDANHSALNKAVVAQKDFIGGNGNSAAPSGNDAHGTACAGIIASRDATRPGIAKGCSLIAARIGMGDGSGGWAFDDYATADAIDWAWREGAAVLSNSWGGGVASDAISRAFGRARTQGRGGLGSVVCIAAGNSQALIDFPGNLPGYVTFGASNPADERKTTTSSDQETWWGSNFGQTMWLLAPGVFISTTDIAGPKGYVPGDFTDVFNGTSAATPHVAATAALILSVAPTLSASEVRDILRASAVRLAGQSAWTQELGWGRLDVAAAVQLAANPSPTTANALHSSAVPSRARVQPKKAAKKASKVAHGGSKKKPRDKRAARPASVPRNPSRKKRRARG